MNIEVEIRARVGDFNKIKKALVRAGAVFVKSETQVDRVFGSAKFLDSNNLIIEGGLSARIREVDGKCKLEFKEILREKGGGIELSCNVLNIETADKMLKKLDFEEAFTVKKKRESYSYMDFTICLDEVEGLGNFIEIEKMTDSEEKTEGIKQECLDLLKKLSPEAKMENRKYGDIIQKIINNSKEETDFK